MKITTRIISGYGLLIAALVVLALYQIVTIRKMQSINHTLREINFKNATSCLDAQREIELLDEYAQKTFLLGDPDYADQLKLYQEDFETSLRQLQSSAASDEEKSEVRRLTEIWDAFAVDLGLMLPNLPQLKGEWPQNLEEDLGRLRIQIESVSDAAKRSINAKLEIFEKTSKTAEIVLICAAIIALSISILVSLLIYRSISKPLALLTEGTRAIAEGKFFYRLDTSRDDEFAQLAKDFNTMTRRLSELDELKKDFVSHVSHEMKAPLASMRETLQILLDQIPGPLAEKQKRLLELNLQSCERLTSMIANLLDLSKIESGVMEYELKSRDLIPLVRTAVAEIEVQAVDRQIQIETILPDEPLPVECDGDRIVQVIVNLASNAIKFSPKAGTVQIRVEASRKLPDNMPEQLRRLAADFERGDDFGLVIVSDSGPGIPDADKEKIFEKFHQVKQEKRTAGQGVGLGLAICRTIVQAHHGAIWAENGPGGGSRFLLLLRPGKREEVASRASLPI
jgi:two-component system sensor histidine kinase GlrK